MSRTLSFHSFQSWRIEVWKLATGAFDMLQCHWCDSGATHAGSMGEGGVVREDWKVRNIKCTVALWLLVSKSFGKTDLLHLQQPVAAACVLHRCILRDVAPGDVLRGFLRGVHSTEISNCATWQLQQFQDSEMEHEGTHMLNHSEKVSVFVLDYVPGLGICIILYFAYCFEYRFDSTIFYPRIDHRFSIIPSHSTCT